jgi:hypothetical protein
MGQEASKHEVGRLAPPAVVKTTTKQTIKTVTFNKPSCAVMKRKRKKKTTINNK